MPGGVFISNRREDTAGVAGRISDRLRGRLGPSNVFFDVEDMKVGRRWREELAERVSACHALIAVIGREWNPISDKENRHRLDDPNDSVRIEVETAVKRGIPIFPVLVDDAALPHIDSLPESLKPLGEWQWIDISETRFEYDIGRLIAALSSLGLTHLQDDAPEAERGLQENQNRREAPSIAARGRLFSNLRVVTAVAGLAITGATVLSVATSLRRIAANERLASECDRLSTGAQPSSAISACRAALKVSPTNARLQYGLGHALLRSGSHEEGIPLLKQAADHGDARAQIELGELCESGRLGELCESGRGVDRDYVQAFAWYRKAADLGNAAAQINIGRLYEEGLGVQRDPDQAATWYMKAAERGDQEAKLALNRLQQIGQLVASARSDPVHVPTFDELADALPPQATGPPTGETQALATVRFSSDEKAKSFLGRFDGGNCFLIKPLPGSKNPHTYQALGHELEPFQRFESAYRREVGVEADLMLELISAEQCPAIDLVRIGTSNGQKPPRLTLKDHEVGRGKPLVGTISNLAGRRAYLVLVDNDGIAHRLDAKTEPGGDAATFNIPLLPDAASVGPTQMLLAIVSDKSIPAFEALHAARLESAAPQLVEDLRQASASVEAYYFQFVN